MDEQCSASDQASDQSGGDGGDSSYGGDSYGGDSYGDGGTDGGSGDDGSQGMDYDPSAAAADYNSADYAGMDGLNGSSGGDTLSMTEKWNSLKAAPGAFLYDAYDRVAAVGNMITGDDAAADRHIDDADAEGDAGKRYLRQAFEGKRIEPSAAEEQRWQRMLDES